MYVPVIASSYYILVSKYCRVAQKVVAVFQNFKLLYILCVYEVNLATLHGKIWRFRNTGYISRNEIFLKIYRIDRLIGIQRGTCFQLKSWKLINLNVHLSHSLWEKTTGFSWVEGEIPERLSFQSILKIFKKYFKFKLYT